MNWGISEELKTAFPNIIAVHRPVSMENVVIPDPSPLRGLGSPPLGGDPHWLVGFTEAEGCFSVIINESSTIKTGFQIQLRFKLTQHIKDENLMKSLVEFLNCGKVYVYKDTVDFKITKFADLINKVLPLFENIPLHGTKAKDWWDFCKVANIMKEKGHLTPEGLKKIRKIKEGMNKGRIY